MKELNLLESWADSVISEKFNNNQAPARMGTPMSKGADRPLPRQVDIQYKAQRAHPELSPEQALALYMSDELVDKEKMDLSQNKVINTVKRDNEKLRRTIDELGSELHDHEKQAARTDQEVARLKDLSAKLKPAGELQQQAVQASADKVQAMLHDLETLRSKPGMDDAKYQELATKINQLKSTSGFANADAQKLTKVLTSLQKQPQVSDDLLNSALAHVEKVEKELEEKEKRFVASTKKNVGIQQKWKSDFKSLNDLIATTTEKANAATKKAEQAEQQLNQSMQDATEMLQWLSNQVAQINPNAFDSSTVASADRALDDIVDQDEVHQTMATNTSLSADDIEKLNNNPSPRLDPNVIDVEPRMVKKQPVTPSQDDEEEIKQASTDDKIRMTESMKLLEEQVGLVEKLLPKLLSLYAKYKPNDVKKWSQGQIVETMKRTMVYGFIKPHKPVSEWATRENMVKYFDIVHNALLHVTPPRTPDLFDPQQGELDLGEPPQSTPQAQPKPGIKESVFRGFLSDVDSLTNGY